VIVVDELTKRYGRSAVVDSVSFRAEPGTVTGFLGPNGAGKSSTLRMLTGLTAPTSGSSTILGRPYARLDNPGRQVGVLLDHERLRRHSRPDHPAGGLGRPGGVAPVGRRHGGRLLHSEWLHPGPGGGPGLLG